jgi:putative acetyltransferase
MIIRYYEPADLEQVMQLFYNTIHTVNNRDYEAAQLEAWAPADMDAAAWAARLEHNHSIVVEAMEQVTGFAELGKGGYVDMLYVHSDYQRQGIATALYTELEQVAKARGCTTVTTEASITARPFFERMGFIVTLEQEKTIRGVALRNYKMEKTVAAQPL